MELKAYSHWAIRYRGTRHTLDLYSIKLHLLLLPVANDVAFKCLNSHLVKVIEVGVLQRIFGLQTYLGTSVFPSDV